MSLHEGSVIAYYNGLDSSGDIDQESSSNDHSLTDSRLIKLQQIDQTGPLRNNHHYHEQAGNAGNSNVSSRPSVRPIRNISSRYDLEKSHSTKDEVSILRNNREMQRPSNQIYLYEDDILPNIPSQNQL